jgi:hypothetical protein
METEIYSPVFIEIRNATDADLKIPTQIAYVADSQFEILDLSHVTHDATVVRVITCTIIPPKPPAKYVVKDSILRACSYAQ